MSKYVVKIIVHYKEHTSKCINDRIYVILDKYSNTCLKWSLSKRPQIGFEDKLWLNAGQKYCTMLRGQHSALLSTFIKLSIVIKVFILSIFEWPFYTAFTIYLVTTD